MQQNLLHLELHERGAIVLQLQLHGSFLCTEEEIRTMMNHINSYPRKKWNGQAPIDLFIKIYGQEAAELLGLERIPPDSIHLTPALFKK